MTRDVQPFIPTVIQLLSLFSKNCNPATSNNTASLHRLQPSLVSYSITVKEKRLLCYIWIGLCSIY